MCVIMLSLLLNLDYICTENPESLEKERFKYTNFDTILSTPFAKSDRSRKLYCILNSFSLLTKLTVVFGLSMPSSNSMVSRPLIKK